MAEEEERKKILPGYPSSKVRLKPEEAAALESVVEHLLSFQNCVATSMEESDAIAFRTIREIEGSFCDHVFFL